MQLWNYNKFKSLVCNADVQVLYLVVKLDYKIAAQLQCVIIWTDFASNFRYSNYGVIYLSQSACDLHFTWVDEIQPT